MAVDQGDEADESREGSVLLHFGEGFGGPAKEWNSVDQYRKMMYSERKQNCTVPDRRERMAEKKRSCSEMGQLDVLRARRR
jgi:ribosomal protein L3